MFAVVVAGLVYLVVGVLIVFLMKGSLLAAAALVYLACVGALVLLLVKKKRHLALIPAGLLVLLTVFYAAAALDGAEGAKLPDQTLARYGYSADRADFTYKLAIQPGAGRYFAFEKEGGGVDGFFFLFDTAYPLPFNRYISSDLFFGTAVLGGAEGCEGFEDGGAFWFPTLGSRNGVGKAVRVYFALINDDRPPAVAESMSLMDSAVVKTGEGRYFVMAAVFENLGENGKDRFPTLAEVVTR